MHMEYNKLRNKVNKFYTRGKIIRYQLGGNAPTLPGVFDGQSDGNGYVWDATLKIWKKDPNTLKFNNPSIIDQQQIDPAKKFGVSFSSGNENDPLGKTTTTFGNNGAIVSENSNQNSLSTVPQNPSAPEQNISKQADTLGSAGISPGTKMGLGIAATAGTAAINIADSALMGDKNFSAGSQAVDSAVHGVSGALMSSGSPYAMVAGAALEGVNFLSKIGGKTVQGYDVNINNSGYSGVQSHMESKSGRIWESRSSLNKRLQKRNEEARLAISASRISDYVAFEQEARMNSVDNVLRNNQIALAGGIDTSLLGS